MIQMSLDTRTIMMCVAFYSYSQASVGYVLVLIDIADCFVFLFHSKRYPLLTRHLHKDPIQDSIMATRRRAHDR